MSNSKFEVSKETTDFVRVVKLIFGPCTNVLCDVLKSEISPSDLVNKYNVGGKKLSKDQETLVYGKDYSKFDVTLLYFLLRNTCTIPQHTNRWGHNPISKDRSVSANIERIRLIRNDVVHMSSIDFSITDFNKKCQDIYDIVQELEKSLGLSTYHQDEVKKINTRPMDQEQTDQLIKEWHEIKKELAIIKAEVKGIRNSIIPPNVKEIYEKYISTWKKDDDLFVETHNFSAMLQRVKDQSYVTFVGVSGSGKTVTCRHIALILQEEGYEVLPTKEFSKLEEYCDLHNPQVFVIDNVLGENALNENKFDKLTTDYVKQMTDPMNKRTKVLMTCQEIVFKNDVVSNCFLNKPKNIVMLHDKENSLNKQDKCDILAKYNIDSTDIVIPAQDSTSNMFPYLCTLFHKYEAYGSDFFVSPIPCILKELDKMKQFHKTRYASLVLLMIHHNGLSKEFFGNTDNNSSENNIDQMKYDLLKKCNVEAQTDSYVFLKALSEMEGTYIRKCGETFTFIDKSMFEIVAYHFGKDCPELFLRYASSYYIIHHIKLTKYKSKESEKEDKSEMSHTETLIEHRYTPSKQEDFFDLCITLTESQFPDFAERLLKEVVDGKFSNVFGNKALKDTGLCRAFIDVIKSVMENKSEPYKELYSLFLSKRLVIVENEGYYNHRVYKHRLLIYSQYRTHEDRKIIYKRAINWVIFFGHNQILQFIVDEMLKYKGNIGDLFETPFHRDIFFNSEMSRVVNTLTKMGTESYDMIGKSDADLKKDYQISVESCTESVPEEHLHLILLGCHSNDVITLQILLSLVDKNVLNVNIDLKKSDIDQKIRRGFDNVYQSPLQIPCDNHNFDMSMFLLNKEANIKLYNEKELARACKNGWSDEVVKLITSGTDVNAKLTSHLYDDVGNSVEEKMTLPLIEACDHGYENTVDKLLEHGAVVNIRDTYQTPLIAACRGHLSIVENLLKHGADVNVCIDLKSPLSRAIIFCYNLRNNGQSVQSQIDIALALFKADPYMSITILTEAFDNVRFDDDCTQSAEDMLKVTNMAYRAEGYFHAYSSSLHYVNIYNIINKIGALNCIYNSNCLPLITACENGMCSVVSELLTEGADVNQQGNYETPLTVACRRGHTDIIEMLLNNEADVNLSAKRGAPLTVACRHGHFNAMKLLIKAGAEVNKLCFCGTPLIVACSNGDIRVVQTLLEAGSDINQDNDGNTPLMYAAAHGNSRVVEELVKKGAIIDTKSTSYSALAMACKNGHLDVVKKLLEAGADVTRDDSVPLPLWLACDNGHANVAVELIKAGADINKENKQIDRNLTNLTVACEKGHASVVDVLLRAGANVNDDFPLIASCLEGHLIIVKALIEIGANVNIKNRCYSPLTAACSKGNLKIAQTLLNAGAIVSMNSYAGSPLTVACKEGHVDIVLELIKAKADVNILTEMCRYGYVIEDMKVMNEHFKTTERSTPLTLACDYGHLGVVVELIKAGADVNMNSECKTPLIAACQSGAKNVVRELLRAGANVNKEFNNATPILTACRYGPISLVMELVDAGANVNLKVSNLTPLTVAFDQKRLGLCKELMKAGAEVNITYNGPSDFRIRGSFTTRKII